MTTKDEIMFILAILLLLSGTFLAYHSSPSDLLAVNWGDFFW